MCISNGDKCRPVKEQGDKTERDSGKKRRMKGAGWKDERLMERVFEGVKERNIVVEVDKHKYLHLTS